MDLILRLHWYNSIQDSGAKIGKKEEAGPIVSEISSKRNMKNKLKKKKMDSVLLFFTTLLNYKYYQNNS